MVRFGYPASNNSEMIAVSCDTALVGIRLENSPVKHKVEFIVAVVVVIVSSLLRHVESLLVLVQFVCVLLRLYA